MKIKSLLIYILLGLIILVNWFFIFVYFQINKPVSSQPMEKTFIIEKGEGSEEIAIRLDEAGLIRGKTWFMTYVAYKGWTGQLQAGEYLLDASTNIPQIALKITRGEVVPYQLKITIPEGFTLKQIDNRLAEADLIESGDLFKYAYLEGYLFPDTYQFDKRMDIEGIINVIRENFNQKLDENLKEEIAQQGKTINQIIIMASLLEKEVLTYQDRQIVSGIFWKRISNNYPLQSCATIAYVLGVDKWRYSIKDTKVESSYNTYQNVGLPAGPICNPGLLSIEAAIYPLETDYNFFLSKPSGQTVFSRTAEEHNENKAKYLE